MNKIFYTLITAFACMLIFASCEREALYYDNNNNNNTEFEGTLNLGSLQVGVTPATEEGTILTRTTNVDVSTYSVAVFEENATIPLKTWKYASMPEIFSLKVGTYRVEAYSHEPDWAEWNNPHYYASQTFDIVNAEVTNLVVLICKMRSIKTSVVFTDSFKALLGYDIEVEMIINNKDQLTYTSS